MDTMAWLAVMAVATVLAIGVAFGMAWAFLQGAFRLMQPAAVRPTGQPKLELVRGTRAVAMQFAQHR